MRLLGLILVLGITCSSCAVSSTCKRKEKVHREFLLGNRDYGMPKKYRKQNMKRHRKGKSGQWAKR